MGIPCLVVDRCNLQQTIRLPVCGERWRNLSLSAVNIVESVVQRNGGAQRVNGDADGAIFTPQMFGANLCGMHQSMPVTEQMVSGKKSTK